MLPPNSYHAMIHLGGCNCSVCTYSQLSAASFSRTTPIYIFWKRIDLSFLTVSLRRIFKLICKRNQATAFQLETYFPKNWLSSLLINIFFNQLIHWIPLTLKTMKLWTNYLFRSWLIKGCLWSFRSVVSFATWFSFRSCWVYIFRLVFRKWGHMVRFRQ